MVTASGAARRLEQHGPTRKVGTATAGDGGAKRTGKPTREQQQQAVNSVNVSAYIFIIINYY
jgi:hypothetical protein